VSVDQVCGIAVRNPQIVSVGRHYGLTVATCVPADPESKGGSEATVRIASADLVPTDQNLRSAYGDFAELESECESFCERVNAREYRVTRRPPVVMLGEERERMHPLPAVPHTVLFWSDPQGRPAVDDQCWRRDLLGSEPAGGGAGVGQGARLGADRRARRLEAIARLAPGRSAKAQVRVAPSAPSSAPSRAVHSAVGMLVT
jgi:hypothetical protein